MLYPATIDFDRNSHLMGVFLQFGFESMTPYDLMVAPTGARLQKADHAALPVNSSEIVAAAMACEAAGANAIHIHVRDAHDCHSLDPDLYNALIDRLRRSCHLHIQVSTEAADIFDVAAQQNCLRHVHATEVSISLREISRDPAKISETYQIAASRGIAVQHILYGPEEITELFRHFERGSIPSGARKAIFVLGRYAFGQETTPADLDPFLSALADEHLNWTVCAFGRHEHDCLLAALQAGGNVRIGFENNRFSSDGTPFEHNAASVAAFVKRAAAAGFTPHQSAPKAT